MGSRLSAFLNALPPFDFIQLLGLLSFALGIACFYQKDDRRLKLLMLFMYINHAIHFALLGALTSTLGSILAILRTGIALKSTSKSVAITFIIVSLSWGAYFATTWLDILPIVGTCIGTYALFCLQGIQMRIGFLLGGLCWLTNNLLIGSIGTSLLEFTLIIVNLSTIYRLHTGEHIKIKKGKTRE